MKTFVIYVVCALGFGLAGGCATSRYSATATSRADSRSIAANVKSALWQDPIVNSFDIDVDVLRSSVQLSGTVDTLEQERRAETIAWNIPGVHAVDNEILVKPAPGLGSSLGLGREVGRGGEEASMLLPRIVGNPELYYGRAVEIEGTVDTILSRNSFTVGSSAFPEKPLLVLTDEPAVRDLSPGDVVRVSGELQPFNRTTVAQRLNAELEPRKFAGWENRASMLGKEVRRIKH